MGAFDRFFGKIVHSTFGFRCKSAGYKYSEILRSLMCVYFCGGSCIEDISRHLMPCLSQHPTLRTCSSDSILRSIEELTEDNITYVSDQGRSYDFNPAEKLNALLLRILCVLPQVALWGKGWLCTNVRDCESPRPWLLAAPQYFMLIRLCKSGCGFEDAKKYGEKCYLITIDKSLLVTENQCWILTSVVGAVGSIGQQAMLTFGYRQ